MRVRKPKWPHNGYGEEAKHATENQGTPKLGDPIPTPLSKEEWNARLRGRKNKQ